MQRYLIAATLAAHLASPALAQSANSKTRSGSANAQVIRPIILTKATGFALRFGRFTVGQTSGSVAVAANGSGSTTGGATFVSGSTTSADRMIVQGDPNRLIFITTGSGTVSNGSAAMSFTTTPSLPAGFIPPPGLGFFTIGGTLSVASGQAPGNYIGSYPVTVSYN